MTNPFRIPLNALRAIEIVARRGALAPAAEELGVTPGAVSQHIRRAEERLGLELFERTPQGLVPTEAMTGIAPRLREGCHASPDGPRWASGGAGKGRQGSTGLPPEISAISSQLAGAALFMGSGGSERFAGVF